MAAPIVSISTPVRSSVSVVTEIVIADSASFTLKSTVIRVNAQVRQRYQLLVRGRLNRGDSGRAEHITLAGGSFPDPRQRLRPHGDAATGPRNTFGYVLGCDVDHAPDRRHKVGKCEICPPSRRSRNFALSAAIIAPCLTHTLPRRVVGSALRWRSRWRFLRWRWALQSNLPELGTGADCRRRSVLGESVIRQMSRAGI